MYKNVEQVFVKCLISIKNVEYVFQMLKKIQNAEKVFEKYWISIKILKMYLKYVK